MEEETRAFLRSAFGFLRSDYETLSKLSIEVSALRNALIQIGGERFETVLQTTYDEATKLQTEHQKITLSGYDALIEKLK